MWQPISASPVITCAEMSLEGFVKLEVDGQWFLVPEYAADDVKIKMAARVNKKEMGVDVNTAAVSHHLLP
jgi:hypothetical protein